ncbi:MAG: CoA ester lyase, partial [Proteobacteria bacterium]|nr:CoA ester lyase [Pseudomonadota bacterium]
MVVHPASKGVALRPATRVPAAVRPVRSALYLPASNIRALAKARALPCDAVILDLEDAVAPEAKTAAREQALAALREGFGERAAVLRVNGIDTPWGREDLAAAVEAKPHAVLAPKVEDPASLRTYHEALGGAPEAVQLWAMVETPRAVLNLPEIAAAADGARLAGLVVGLNDLAQALRARWTPGRAAFSGVLQATVVAARAHGLVALDAVFNDLDDAAGLEAECRQGRELGFDGKTVIHPRQIEAANRAFSPADTELAWARAVVTAFADPANAGRGALRVANGMVERLHLLEAERLLAAADA